MATAYVLSFSLAVLSCFFYHVLQKITPSEVNPVVSLAATYVVSLVATLALLPFFPLRGTWRAEIGSLTWPSYVLGFTVVGIEFGFFLAYRAGWNASAAALGVNTLASVALLVVSTVFLKESLGPRQIAGLFVCIAGLWLLTSGKSN